MRDVSPGHRRVLARLLSVLAFLLFGATLSIAADPAPEPAPKPKIALKFTAYDGDPPRESPKEMTFQITRRDVRTPSIFQKLGERIPGTMLVISDFRYLVRASPTSGGEEDVSELILVDSKTKKKFALPLNKVVEIE